ncbi:MAG: serine hydrolase domain-containing protein [bacterium]
MRAVSEAFTKNFSGGLEVGAGLSIFRNGVEVVSLCGGYCDSARSKPWSQDTLVLIWSATKGVAAACTLHAMQQNGATLENRVAEFWPEFAQAGKEAITLGHVLSHRAGLCVLDDVLANLLDRISVVRAIENQKPVLPVDAGPAYGPKVFGFVLDEIVRRLTGGESLADYWRRVFANPLGIDLWIGLPESEHPRVASILPPRPGRPAPGDELFARAFGDADSLTRRAFGSPSGLVGISSMNAPEVRSASLPSMGGIGSAHALAKFYAMLASGGALAGQVFFEKQTLGWMSTPLTQGFDPVLQREMSFSAGFMLDPVDANGHKIRSLFGPSPSAFGHAGAGGSLGFADVERGFGFAYVMNQMESGVLPHERCVSLVRSMESTG